jgi:hypothetical protein
LAREVFDFLKPVLEDFQQFLFFQSFLRTDTKGKKQAGGREEEPDAQVLCPPTEGSSSLPPACFSPSYLFSGYSGRIIGTSGNLWLPGLPSSTAETSSSLHG